MSSKQLLILTLCAFTTGFSAQSLQGSSITDMESSPVRILGSDGSSIRLGFSSKDLEPGIVEKNGEQFEIFKLPEEGMTFEYGMPLLPAVSRLVLVPPDAGLEFSFTYGEPRRVRSTLPPAVCDDSVMIGSPIRPLTSLYPGKLAEMSEPFVIRGARLVKVTTYPVQFDPETNSYLSYDNIETSIGYTNDEPINPSVAPVRRHRSKIFKEAIGQLAINGSELGRDDPQDSESPYVGHYLIVANQATLGYQMVRNWIEFRRRTGYKVDILAAANPNDPQDTKDDIKARYDAYLDRGEDPFEYIALIGDLQYDQQPDYGPENYLQSFDGWSIWGGFPHADFLFACLEGGNNDIHPDVAYARFPAGSEGAANLIFGRTLLYEEKPRMTDPEWFRRGVVYSQHWGNDESSAWHISIHTNVRYGEEVLQSLGFNDIYFYENTDYDQPGQEIGPRMAEQYNRGVNVMIGRAEIYYWQTNFQSVNGVNENNVDHVYPIDIVYSGHGEWANQVVFRSGAWPNNMKGPVARTCGWGWPASAPTSYIWLSMVNGVLQRDLPLGVARMLSVSSIETVFPDFQIPNVGGQLYSHIKTDTDMYGDPALQPWIGVPRLPEINMPETIPASTKTLEVFVHGWRSDEPMPGAQVTLYAPGNMPALNQPAQYAAYTGYIQKTTKADAEGIARFFLVGNETFVANRPVCISASGRDIRPFTDTLRIGNVQGTLALADYQLSARDGNNDEVVNPGESFDLTITVSNPGTTTDYADVLAEAISASPYLEVIENSMVEIGNIPHGEEVQAGASMAIRFLPETPDGTSRPVTRPILKLVFTSGDDSWTSQIQFDPVAPNFEIFSIIGGNIVDDEVQNLVLDIKNQGSADASRCSVELRSLGMGVTVVDNRSELDNLDADAHDRISTPFTLSGNRVVVPGSKNKMVAIFTTEEGLVDSAFFELQVMRERAHAPTGPDSYGYICFDDTDTDWDVAPVYEWIEINPQAQDAQYDGVRLRDLEGNSEFDIGKCLVVDLGFTTQFYGKEYHQITIATNGFIAMGDQRRITNYSNWRMDQAMGAGVGMIAAYWDDIRFGQNGAIWKYVDEDEGRFIIEWERMRYAQGEGELTFQVIILDKDVWITESGDPNVIIQYKSIANPTNIRNGDEQWSNNIPYGSVGISSPDGRTGINYSFLNARPVSAEPVAPRRALLFSTSPRYKACTLFGYITDARTGEPIEGARVYTEHGFVDDSDENGFWQIIDALAEVPFDITANKQGYNDSTFTEQYVAEGDTIEFDFALLHPEFTPSTDFLSDRLDPNFTSDLHWSIYNGGNGPLTWTAEKRLLGDANASPWEHRRQYRAAQITGDDRIEGVIFADNKFYVSGANGNEENLIYVISKEGELLDSFPQIGSGRYGYKDMDWDGQYIWAAGEDSIYALTLAGEIAAVWSDGGESSAIVACDPAAGILYLSTTTSNIMRFDMAGNRLEGVLPGSRMRMYGLAYWPEDPDGYNLYVLNRPITNNPHSLITKMNVETGDTMTVFEFPQDSTSTGQMSAWISNEFDVYSWVLMTIQNIGSNFGGDKIEIHQLDARKDWMNLDLWEGTLDPEETQELVLHFDSEALPDTLFEGELIFRHNADDGETIIRLSLDVIGPELPEPFNLLTPTDGDTIIALPQHGDSLDLPEMKFSWEPTRDWNIADSVITYVLGIGNGDQQFVKSLRDTTITLSLDTLDLPIMFEQYIWWVKAVSGDDTVGCIAPFTFRILPNEIDARTAPIPVEFGLQSIYPSPFNSSTTISFGADRAVRTTLKVYDLLGREVTTLFDQTPRIANYRVVWNANAIPTGLYVVKLESAGRSEIKKVTLVR